MCLFTGTDTKDKTAAMKETYSQAIDCGKEVEQLQQETSVVDNEMLIIKNSERWQ
jgi:hypothetical protein